jgi:hypothetical protein
MDCLTLDDEEYKYLQCFGSYSPSDGVPHPGLYWVGPRAFP